MQANPHGVRSSMNSQMSESRSGNCIRECEREVGYGVYGKYRVVDEGGIGRLVGQLRMRVTR